MTVVGRVVDAAHREQPGIPVHLNCSYAPPQQAVTGRAGDFRFNLPSRPNARVEAAILATAPDGTAATATAEIDPLGPPEIRVGVLILRATVDLEVRVLHADRPIRGARVFAGSVPLRHAIRDDGRMVRPWRGWSHEAVSDDRGLATLERVPVGAVRLLAIADGPLRATARLRTDEVGTPFELSLSAGRDVRVEVVSEEGDVPIPGCVLDVSCEEEPIETPWPRATTDERGVAVLAAVPDDVTLSILIGGPDWCSSYLPGVTLSAPPGTRTVRAQVPTPARLQIPIVAEDGPLPADGTFVELYQDGWVWWPGMRTGLARQGVVNGRALVIEVRGSATQQAIARLPDGRIGVLALKVGDVLAGKQPRPVVFRNPREITVRVSERRTGEPARGVVVSFTVARGGVTVPRTRTDTDGLAQLTGLPAVRGWVAVCSNPDGLPAYRQGLFSQRQEVDLANENADLTFHVEEIVDAVVEVRTERGPGLPEQLGVQMYQHPNGVGWTTPLDLRFDPVRGSVQFRVRRPLTRPLPPAILPIGPSRIEVRVTSATHATEYADLEFDERLNRLTAQLRLAPAGSLVARVREPRGQIHTVSLERRDAKEQWTAVPDGPLVSLGSSDEDRYEALRPGLYRLRETELGWVSESVEVRSHTTPAVLDWDLVSTGWAEGVVELPKGIRPEGLDVLVLAPGDVPRVLGVHREVVGTSFRVQVPGDRPVLLAPVHPQCTPDPADGHLTVTQPEQGLRLRMQSR